MPSRVTNWDAEVRGRFVTVEGSEGVGKSTNIDFIEARLQAHGFDVVVTREPGGTPLAEEVRGLLLKQRRETVDPLAETLLVFAARAQHVREVIAPALEDGRWVLSDRFTDASFAYQGGGRGVREEYLATLAAWVHGDCEPDITFFLDAPLETSFSRIADRDLDRFEREQRAFFDRVQKNYRDRAAAIDRIVRVDAAQSIDQVQRAIGRRLDAFIEGLGAVKR